MIEDKFDDDTQSNLSKSDGDKQDNVVEGVVQIGYSNSSDSDKEKGDTATEHFY